MTDRPLKLSARDAGDLSVISTMVQDALVRPGDMVFRGRERRFLMLLDRFMWERDDGRARRRQALSARSLGAPLRRRCRRAEPRSRPGRAGGGSGVAGGGRFPGRRFRAAGGSGVRRWQRRPPGRRVHRMSADRSGAAVGHAAPAPAPRRRGELRRAVAATEPIVIALPRGRILREVVDVARRAGVEPEPAFDDPASRRLRFDTNFRASPSSGCGASTSRPSSPSAARSSESPETTC